MFYDTDETLMEEQIITKCGPYIRLLKHLAAQGIKRPLIRGTVDNYPELTRIQVKPRTQTMNMSKLDTEIANEWFKEKFGIAARTETVFTTTNRGMASNYGYVRYIFPIGKFSTIHSEKYKDLYFALKPANVINELKKEKYDFATIYSKIGGTDEPKPEEVVDVIIKEDEETYRKVVKQLLDKGDYRKNDYANAFKSGHEIMLRCNAYFIVNSDDRIEDFINEFIWEDFGF